MSDLRIVSVTVSCSRMHSGPYVIRVVMSDAQCHVGYARVLAEIQESNLKVALSSYGNWSVDV